MYGYVYIVYLLFLEEDGKLRFRAASGFLFGTDWFIQPTNHLDSWILASAISEASLDGPKEETKNVKQKMWGSQEMQSMLLPIAILGTHIKSLWMADKDPIDMTVDEEPRLLWQRDQLEKSILTGKVQYMH